MGHAVLSNWLTRGNYVFKAPGGSPKKKGGQKRSTGNGKKILAAALAEATDIRKDVGCASEMAGRASKKREAKAKANAAPIIADRPAELELSGNGTAKETLVK